MTKTSVRSKHLMSIRLEFLYGLYLSDCPLDRGRLDLLIRKGMISEGDTTNCNYDIVENLLHQYKNSERKDSKDLHLNRGISNRDLTLKEDIERIADSYVDIENDSGEKEYEGVKDIEVSDWKIKRSSDGSWPEDFCQWIDSINRGFGDRVMYKPFNMYVQQAYGWLSENGSINNFAHEDEQYDYARNEKQRCTINSLYFLNKYHSLKEGEISDGDRRYTAWKCQEVVCYLFDLGANLLIGKPRQIGFTSTIGGLGIKRTVFHKSYFTKFITHTLQKGEEIFEDKLKFPFYHLPYWMRPTVNNDRDNLIRLYYKPGKGSIGGVDSKLQVVSPTKTAINGGSPNLVMIDEVGLIDILSPMMNEGRPTLFWVNPKTNVMEMKRQLIGWGTGGEMDGGGHAFEREFRTALEAWNNRNFHYGIIPLFFDAYSKPGLTGNIYEQEKSFYYAKGEKSKIQFHQAYPITLEDMFLISPDTIVDIEKINAQIQKIRNLPPTEGPQHGYLEPIFDKNVEYPDTFDVPYKPIGAKFVPTEDDSEYASIVVWQHPQSNWSNRYFQGTDPIFTESGHSKMASAIWDNVNKTVSAVMNFRTKDYRYCYLQAMLLGLYYDKQQTRNLVENNVGSGFMDYLEGRGYWKTLVPNKMIAPHLQNPMGGRIGIRKTGVSSKFILHKLQELLEVYYENLYIEELFLQLKTYVRKITPSGKETFKVENSKYYYDDVIDAIVYAYICGDSFTHLTPMGDEERKKKKVGYRYTYDGEYNLILEKRGI